MKRPRLRKLVEWTAFELTEIGDILTDFIFSLAEPLYLASDWLWEKLER